MNQIREILTKAVVSKGKKIFRIKEKLKPEFIPNSILGCLVINHNFNAVRENDTVVLTGSFEVNIWYSHNNYQETSILKEVIGYREIIKTCQLVQEYGEDNLDVVVKMLQNPTITDGFITLDMFEVEIMVEAEANIIGETLIQVSILEPCDIWPEDVEINNNVNEDFIQNG